MSLTRTTLRLGLQLALTNNGEEPWPTIANERVFDSKMTPFEVTDPKAAIPTIMIYTDSDLGEPLSVQNGGPPYRRTLDVIFELMLGMVGDEEHGQTYELPAADAQVEAMLDLLEYQTKFALTNVLNKWTALLWSHPSLIMRIHRWTSERFVSAEGNVRLGGRAITATMEVHDDDLPNVDTVADPTALPDRLKKLMDAVAGGGSTEGYPTELFDKLLSGGIPHTVVAPPLKTVHIETVVPDGTPPVRAIVKDLDV